MELGRRKHVWESMLVADMNRRYYQSLTDRYRRLDFWAKVLIAVTSSAAVSGWAVWSHPGVDWIWKLASAVAAVVAIALPLADPAKSLRIASELAGEWFAVLREYELLWARIDDTSDALVDETCRPLAEQEKKLSELEAALSINKRIAQQSEDAMRKVRAYPVD